MSLKNNIVRHFTLIFWSLLSFFDKNEENYLDIKKRLHDRVIKKVTNAINNKIPIWIANHQKSQITKPGIVKLHAKSKSKKGFHGHNMPYPYLCNNEECFRSSKSDIQNSTKNNKSTTSTGPMPNEEMKLRIKTVDEINNSLNLTEQVKLDDAEGDKEKQIDLLKVKLELLYKTKKLENPLLTKTNSLFMEKTDEIVQNIMLLINALKNLDRVQQINQTCFLENPLLYNQIWLEIMQSMYGKSENNQLKIFFNSISSLYAPSNEHPTLKRPHPNIPQNENILSKNDTKSTKTVDENKNAIKEKEEHSSKHKKPKVVKK